MSQGPAPAVPESALALDPELPEPPSDPLEVPLEPAPPSKPELAPEAELPLDPELPLEEAPPPEPEPPVEPEPPPEPVLPMPPLEPVLPPVPEADPVLAPELPASGESLDESSPLEPQAQKVAVAAAKHKNTPTRPAVEAGGRPSVESCNDAGLSALRNRVEGQGILHVQWLTAARSVTRK